MGVHCWVSLRRQVFRVRRAAWAMFPALAGPAGSPLPTDDAGRTIPWRVVARASTRLSASRRGRAGILGPGRRHGSRMFVSIPSRQRHPLRWATPTVVAVLWVAFVWTSTLPGGRQRALLLEWGALSGGQLPADILRSWSDGEHWLRLFTALFLHADWAHLLGNLVFLLIF